MMIGLALAIALLCRRRRRAQILMWALGGAFALACLVAMAEAATGLHLPSFRAGVENRGGLFGVGSLFGNQNNFAAFLSLSLPYFAVLPIVFRDVRLRAVGFVGGGTALLFILVAGSKSGLLSAGFVVIGLLVLVGTDRRARGRLLVAGGIAVMAVALVVPILSGAGPVKLDERTVTKLDFNILRSQVETDQGSGGVRSALLGDGLRIIDSTNGLGVGAGNAESQVRSLVDSPVVANLHNWWLEVLVNGGVVGLALYLAFFLTLLRGQAARQPAHAGPVRAVHVPRRGPVADRLDHRQRRPLDGDPLHAHVDHVRAGHGRTRPRAATGAAIRILILSHMYPSAVNPTGGIFVHEQARALVELGHDVRVVSPTAWAPPLLSRWRAYRDVPGVDTIDGIPVLYPRKVTLPGARLRHRNNDAMLLAIGRPLRRIHARWPFDVIHAQMVVPDGWAATRMGSELGVPVVATAHRADVLDVPAHGERSRARVIEAVEDIGWICSVSQAIADAAQALATPRRPIRIVPNGADTRVFVPRPAAQARARLGLPDDRPVVTFVGKLVPRKGVDTLVEAIGLLGARPEGAPLLVVAGIGEMRPQLERRAAELGVAQSIRFVGKIPHDDVGWWMSAGDLFVLPSLSEGLPTVVCEAMNCGRPVVATAVDGTPEIVRDGRTGLLVAPGDADALATAMARILDDPDLAERMGAEALRIGREEYTWTANARRMVEIYEEATA